MIKSITNPTNRNYLKSEQNDNLAHLSDKKKEQLHKLFKLVIDQAVYTKKDRFWTWCHTRLNYRKAKMYAYIGDMKKVHQMMLDMVKDKDESDINIARLLAYLGNTNDAIKWINNNCTEKERSWNYITPFYCTAVKGLLNVGDIEGAKKMAEKPGVSEYRNKPYNNIIKALIYRNKIEAAQALADESHISADVGCIPIIKALVLRGNIKEAKKKIKKLYNNQNNGDCAVMIGKAIALRGNFKDAKEAVKDVVKCDWWCVTPYLEIAKIQVDLDDLNGMENTINELRREYSYNINHNADIVVEIKAIAHQGKFKEAIKKADEFLNCYKRCNAYAEILKEFVYKGYIEHAKKLASKAAEEMSIYWKEVYFKAIMELVDQGYVDAAISMLEGRDYKVTDMVKYFRLYSKTCFKIAKMILGTNYTFAVKYPENYLDELKKERVSSLRL